MSASGRWRDIAPISVSVLTKTGRLERMKSADCAKKTSKLEGGPAFKMEV